MATVTDSIGALTEGLLQLQATADNEMAAKQSEVDALQAKMGTVDELTAQLEKATALAEERLRNVTLLQEQCDAVKPTIAELLDDESGEDAPALTGDQRQRLETFLNFSVPGEVLEEEVEPIADVDGLDELKDQAEADAADEPEEVADEPEENDETASATTESDPEPEEDPSGEGEAAFDDEVALTEVEWWEKRGAAYSSSRPVATNTVTQVKDPSDPSQLMATGYKFNITCADKADELNPTFHISESNEGYSLLRIRCGRPYQDLCYRVSDKEWLTDAESGYLCDYADGVFRLHVNMKMM